MERISPYVAHWKYWNHMLGVAAGLRGVLTCLGSPVRCYRLADQACGMASEASIAVGRKQCHPQLELCAWQQVLHAAVLGTSGPVVEFGMGFFSTPMLHDLCKSAARRPSQSPDPLLQRVAMCRTKHSLECGL